MSKWDAALMYAQMMRDVKTIRVCGYDMPKMDESGADQIGLNRALCTWMVFPQWYILGFDHALEKVLEVIAKLRDEYVPSAPERSALRRLGGFCEYLKREPRGGGSDV